MSLKNDTVGNQNIMDQSGLINRRIAVGKLQ